MIESGLESSNEPFLRGGFHKSSASPDLIEFNAFVRSAVFSRPSLSLSKWLLILKSFCEMDPSPSRSKVLSGFLDSLRNSNNFY